MASLSTITVNGSTYDIGAGGWSTTGGTAGVAAWYRIAKSSASVGNNVGTFWIEGLTENNSTSVCINAAISYSATPALAQNFGSLYSAGGVNKARIVYNKASSGNYAYVEVYASTAAATTINVKFIGIGWEAVSPSTKGSVPSGYTSKEIVFTDGQGAESYKVTQSHDSTSTADLPVLFSTAGGMDTVTDTTKKSTELTFCPDSGTLKSTGFQGSGTGLTKLNASNLSTGTVPFERLPVGTAATQVAQGNHTHTGYATSSHNHAASEINSGTLAIDRIPTGTTATTVAKGDHVHGSITNAGAITTAGVALANGDALVFADSSASNVLKKSSLTFGTSTTTYLRNDGTWATPSSNTSNTSSTPNKLYFSNWSGSDYFDGSEDKFLPNFLNDLVPNRIVVPGSLQTQSAYYTYLVIFTTELPEASCSIGYYNSAGIFTWENIYLTGKTSNSNTAASAYILPIFNNNFVVTMQQACPIYYNNNVLRSVLGYNNDGFKANFTFDQLSTSKVALLNITGRSATCLKTNTSIELANGTTKRIDAIVVGDTVKTWDPVTKAYSEAVVTFNSFTDKNIANCYDKWIFEDGTYIETVNDHSLFNATKLKLLKMSQWDIGDCAVRADGAMVKLISHKNIVETTNFADIKLDSNGLFFANGLATMQ